MNGPGFSNIYEHPEWTDPRERYSVVLSSFSPIPFTIDTSYIYRHLGKDLGNLASVRGRVLDDEFIWPREPSQIPVEVFGFEAVVQPDGFITFGKNWGAIHIMDLSGFPQRDPVRHIIADEWPFIDWFYHRVVWKDMDLDGRLDAVACRSRRNEEDGYTNQFVWWRHPEGNPFSSLWEPTVISDMCDTMSIITTLPSGGRDVEVIFTLGFWTEQIVVHWSNDPTGRWSDPNMIESRIIDNGSGDRYFDFEFVDMNKDGRRDLLVTINQNVNGSMWIYEIPDDFKNGVYTKHPIAIGFDSTSGLPGGGSPGSAFAIYPTIAAEEAGGKPWILLSGDDDGRLYYFTPLSEDPNNWEYSERRVLVDEGIENIIGRPSTADLDGDGYNEMFIPSYFANKIIMMTWAP